MELIAKKCDVMHYGKNKIKRDYMVTDLITREHFSLSSSSIERDMGILVSIYGSSSYHMDWIKYKASRTLNLLKRTFEYYNADIARDTFCSLISLLLKYAVILE